MIASRKHQNQTPEKLQAPTTNIQRTTKLQTLKRSARPLVAWSFFLSLALGVWVFSGIGYPAWVHF